MRPWTVCGLAVVAGIFVTASIGYGGGDGDLWWQRQLGEAVLRMHALPATLGPATFSAPGATWIPHEWIFATLWALAKRSGNEAFFRLGCAGLAFVTLAVEALRSRAAAPRARAVMLVIVAYALIPSFGLRAQVVGWPLLALIMLALESGPRRAWLALPISIVWYNLHASALIVPCIVLIHGVGQAIEARRPIALLSPLALAAACALASLATPFGAALPRFAISWSSNPATGLIFEWAPAAPDKILIIAGVFIIVLLLAWGELRGAHMSWPQRLLAIALFAATMLHIRNLGLFCVVAGPWAAMAMTAVMPRGSPLKPYGWRNDGGLAVLGVCLAVVLVVLRVRAPVSAGPIAPAVARLSSLHAPLRVACEDFSWCSRFAGDSNVRVLLDGRTDAYPKAVFDDYRKILKGDAGDALPVLARWNIDAALVHEKGPLAKTLRRGGWKLLRGGEPAVYARP